MRWLLRKYWTWQLRRARRQVMAAFHLWYEDCDEFYKDKFKSACKRVLHIDNQLARLQEATP